MQFVLSRIWTRVAVSISYDDNDYTTGRGTSVARRDQGGGLALSESCRGFCRSRLDTKITRNRRWRQFHHWRPPWCISDVWLNKWSKDNFKKWKMFLFFPLLTGLWMHHHHRYSSRWWPYHNSKNIYLLNIILSMGHGWSSVSSTEKDIDTRLTKAWTATDRLSIIWKSDLTDKRMVYWYFNSF